MSAHSVVRIYVTILCREKADTLLGKGKRKSLASYAAEQWRLGNYKATDNRSRYMEMPPRANDRESVLWFAELDATSCQLVLLDIGPRDSGKRDGFAQYVADVCGRFVGGVLSSLSN